MNTRRFKSQLLSLSAFSFFLFALSGLCMAQTIRYLGYNSTNFTVQGFTNTNALTFTNPVMLPIGSGIAGVLESVDEQVTVTGGLVLGGAMPTLQFTATNYFVWESGVTTNGILLVGPLDFANSTNKSTTRSNLFGSVGISTNIQIVRVGGTTNTLVFSNGLLHQVTTP